MRTDRMPIRFTVPAAVVLLALAVPVAAQHAVGGQVTVTVGEVLGLEVTEAADSVRLQVRSNSRWRVEAVLEDGTGDSWSAGVVAMGDPGRSRIALSRRRLAELAGAPAHAAPRFLLSGY